MLSNENTQLWKEEPERLAYYASSIPENGTIVEIGTADGGTARLLYEATKEKNIQIYTVDINPSKQAYELLKETNVVIVRDDSSNHARKWVSENRLIDFLFIDGDHSFEGIYKDFSAWLPCITTDSQILFHDVDPPDRGGIAHFGVRIFIDTLISKRIMQDIRHEYRFVLGRKGDSEFPSLSCSDFFNTFKDVGRDINFLTQNIFEDSLDNGLRILEQKKDMTSLEACYCIKYLLDNYYSDLLQLSNCAAEMLRWAEMLWMLDHAYGCSFYPENIDKCSAPENVRELSGLIAAEHVRCNIYKNILSTIVSWTP